MSSRLVLVLAMLLGAVVAVIPRFDGHEGRIATGDGEQLMQRYRDYNLHLAFARPAPESHPGVRVRIVGARGVVYEGVSAEPMLFARLPRGVYRVTAEHAGRAETQAVAVDDTAAPALHLFDWKDAAG
jgi:hypothetical protein